MPRRFIENDDKLCGDCAFCTYFEEKDIHLCRRFPPSCVVGRRDGGSYYNFPIVCPDRIGCGEWVLGVD